MTISVFTDVTSEKETSRIYRDISRQLHVNKKNNFYLYIIFEKDDIFSTIFTGNLAFLLYGEKRKCQVLQCNKYFLRCISASAYEQIKF